MARPPLEVADILNRHGDAFLARHRLSRGQLKVIGAIRVCRTAALGGHVMRCGDCDHATIAYNSLYGDFSVKLSACLSNLQTVWASTGRTANNSRGACHQAQSIAPRPCIRLDPQRVRTMKQSMASAARLRGGGPILPTALEPWSCSGHRHLESLHLVRRDSRPVTRGPSRVFRAFVATRRPLGLHRW